MKTILKVIVGSQAHGLATPDSDFDYRGVFVTPTSELLKLGGHTQQTSWIEGKDDDTSWEIGHFLNLAIHCNPTILETFLAPLAPTDNTKMEDQDWHEPYGEELQDLFPYIWNSTDVMNAFIGYGLNQRKKFFDDKDKRASKYAVAYLRTLYNAYELLNTGTFTIKVVDTEVGEMLKKWKALASHEILQNYSGEVISQCLKWERKVIEAYTTNPKKEANLAPVNEFLLKIRKELW